MQHSESIAALAPALVKAQGALKAVEKSKVNPHFKSKYAPLEDIIGELRKPLFENGLAMVQTFAHCEAGILIETTLIHTSGEWLRGELVLPVEKATSQAVGSAITYGRRYGAAAFMCVVSDEDDDGNAASAGNDRPKASDKPKAGGVEDFL